MAEPVVEIVQCPMLPHEDADRRCKGARCAWWDVLQMRCCVPVLAVALWRLSTKLPGEIADASYGLKLAVEGMKGQGRE